VILNTAAEPLSGNAVLEITGGNSSFGYAEWRESPYGLPSAIVE
jgi:hypothetical protein